MTNEQRLYRQEVAEAVGTVTRVDVSKLTCCYWQWLRSHCRNTVRYEGPDGWAFCKTHFKALRSWPRSD